MEARQPSTPGPVVQVMMPCLVEIHFSWPLNSHHASKHVSQRVDLPFEKQHKATWEAYGSRVKTRRIERLLNFIFCSISLRYAEGYWAVDPLRRNPDWLKSSTGPCEHCICLETSEIMIINHSHSSILS